MKITIIGGGNIGTLIGAEAAYKGHDVVIYTSDSRGWASALEVYDAEDGFLFSAPNVSVTCDLAQAVTDAELIWITYPASLFSTIADKLCPYISANQLIGVVPGSGGAEFAFLPLIQKGCVLFGLQRVHSIARMRLR